VRYLTLGVTGQPLDRCATAQMTTTRVDYSSRAEEPLVTHREGPEPFNHPVAKVVTGRGYGRLPPAKAI
jgi:hypothetical protein